MVSLSDRLAKIKVNKPDFEAYNSHIIEIEAKKREYRERVRKSQVIHDDTLRLRFYATM